jgi:prevent-host-death family protein
MIQAGVREMKDHLSEYLRRVRSGEQVVITDRGRPVATLVGVEEGASENLARNLVRTGIGEWSGGKPKGLADPPCVEGRRAAEAVVEDRR